MSDYGGRLFLAITLPEPLRRRWAARLGALPAKAVLPGRVVPPRNWHITLKFLGATDPDAGTRLVDTLGSEDLGPSFDLSFGGFGAFPKAARARILYLACSRGTDALAGLADAVERAGYMAGFERSRQPLHPHVTLCRIRPPLDARPLIAELPDLLATMRVNSLVLVRSRLLPAGAEHETLARWQLGESP